MGPIWEYSQNTRWYVKVGFLEIRDDCCKVKFQHSTIKFTCFNCCEFNDYFTWCLCCLFDERFVRCLLIFFYLVAIDSTSKFTCFRDFSVLQKCTIPLIKYSFHRMPKNLMLAELKILPFNSKYLWGDLKAFIILEW